MKWDDAAPTHRKSIADALTPITEAMIAADRGRPRHKVPRRAIRIHCNKERRSREHPHDVAAALVWLPQNTRQVSDLMAADFLRKVASTFERKLDGQRAAYDTIRMRRTTFGNILGYADERQHQAGRSIVGLQVCRRGLGIRNDHLPGSDRPN